METLSLAVAFLLVSLSLSFLAFRHGATINPKLPLGGAGWPIVGETLHFFFNPEKFIRDRMTKYSPEMFRTNFFGENVVVICGPNGRKFLFSNEHKHFALFFPKSIRKLFHFSSETTVDDDGVNLKFARTPGPLKREALVQYVAGKNVTARTDA